MKESINSFKSKGTRIALGLSLLGLSVACAPRPVEVTKVVETPVPATPTVPVTPAVSSTHVDEEEGFQPFSYRFMFMYEEPQIEGGYIRAFSMKQPGLVPDPDYKTHPEINTLGDSKLVVTDARCASNMNRVKDASQEDQRYRLKLLGCNWLIKTLSISNARRWIISENNNSLFEDEASVDPLGYRYLISYLEPQTESGKMILFSEREPEVTNDGSLIINETRCSSALNKVKGVSQKDQRFALRELGCQWVTSFLAVSRANQWLVS